MLRSIFVVSIPEAGLLHWAPARLVMSESLGAGLVQQTPGALDETGRTFNVVDERLACGGSVTVCHRSDETAVMSRDAAAARKALIDDIEGAASFIESTGRLPD